MAWNKINWDLSEVEKKFIDEKLFIWDNDINSFNEENNQIGNHSTIANIYQNLTKDILDTNLTFHKKYKPELY